MIRILRRRIGEHYSSSNSRRQHFFVVFSTPKCVVIFFIQLEELFMHCQRITSSTRRWCMYCNNCGTSVPDGADVCRSCGAALNVANAPKRFVRPRNGRKIAGVCLGTAQYFNTDVTIVRVVWLIAALVPPGIGFLAYLAAWIVMPCEP